MPRSGRVRHTLVLWVRGAAMLFLTGLLALQARHGACAWPQAKAGVASGKSPATVTQERAASGDDADAAIAEKSAESKSPGKSADSKAAAAEFKAVKRDFQQKFKSKLPADRVWAVGRLAKAPGREAVDLVWQLVLKDETPAVREAVVTLFTGWRDEPAATGAILDSLTRTTRKSGMDHKTYCALRGLAGAENEELQESILEYLDEFLGTSKSNQAMIHTLADDLGQKPAPDGLRTMMLFSRAKFFEKNFGYRRCVLQSAVRVKGNETITFLIDTLPRLKGLVQHDVIMHLTRVTGQNFRDNADAWKAWWVSQQQKLPDRVEPIPLGGFGSGRGYYGIAIGAKRVVFVLDISRSMENGNRIGAAKRELVAAIESLTDDVLFGIIFFDRAAHVWSRDLQPAAERIKNQAINAVQAQETRGGTSSYDALEAAFQLDPEAIYFVSDGEPRTGKIVDPAAIVNAVSQINHVRRVSVHTIGIGTDDPANPKLGQFMRRLAEVDWGEYQGINQ